MPPDPPDIAAYIAYQLDRLGQRDAAYEFQELCLHLGRAIISPNLIRSTGPVSSGRGGDQGRDVETFRGHLEDRNIVVACTLQKEGIKAKISADVTKICSHGGHVDVIYAMCTAPVPIAIRHELQEECRTAYGVDLEILDGEAIADSLADVETFWIARRYLSVPEDVSPRQNDPLWYSSSRSRWLEPDRSIGTWGDLEEVRGLWRHVVFSEGPREDLDRWHDILAEAADPAGEDVRRRAFYEQAVLQVRGLERVSTPESDFEAYFSIIESASDDADLEDLQALLSYLTTATLASDAELTIEALASWRSRLEARLDQLIEEASSPGRCCSLLGTSAALDLTLPLDGDEMPLASLERAVGKWIRILEYADETVLYPIDRISKTVRVWAPLLSDSSKYMELTSKLDSVIRSRSGGIVAAGHARDRAMASLTAGKLESALLDFDRARTGWSVAGSFRGATLALHMMATCYLRLGLNTAAKYCALAAAGITAADGIPDELSDLTPQLLMQISQIEYRSGNWVSAAEFADLGIRFYDFVGIAPWEEEDEARDATFMCLFGPSGLALALDLPISSYLVNLAESAGVGNQVGPGEWDGMEEAVLVSDIVSQLGAAPFEDCGIVRSTRFESAAGQWFVSCPNNFAAMLATERLVATLQMLMLVPDIAEHGYGSDPVVVHVFVGERSWDQKSYRREYPVLGSADEPVRPRRHLIDSLDRRRNRRILSRDPDST